MKMSFLVELEIPAGVSVEDACAYVKNAVATECGSFNPQNPLFHLDRRSVRAVYVKNQQRKPAQ